MSWQGVNDISCPAASPTRPAVGNTAPDPQRPGRPDQPREPRLPAPVRQRLQLPQDGDPRRQQWRRGPRLLPDALLRRHGRQVTDANGQQHRLAPQPVDLENRSDPTTPFPDAGGRTRRTPTTSMPSRSSIPGCTRSRTGSVSGCTSRPRRRSGLAPRPRPRRDANGNLILNHSPLDVGDNLPVPPDARRSDLVGLPDLAGDMAAYTGTGGWGDPVFSVNRTRSGSRLGLRPIPPTPARPDSIDLDDRQRLPPRRSPSPARPTPAPFSDGGGSLSASSANPSRPVPRLGRRPDHDQRPELRRQGVRPRRPALQSRLGLQRGYFTTSGYQDCSAIGGFARPASTVPVHRQRHGQPAGLRPRGADPARSSNDLRVDPSDRARPSATTRPGRDPAQPGLGHVVDRLHERPGLGHQPQRLHPPTWQRPADLPVVPAALPSPLRGIQIQIRVVDPRNERSKVLTIRQDFTDKL